MSLQPRTRAARPGLPALLSALLLPAALVLGCDDPVGPGEEGEPQDRILFASTRAGNVSEFGQPLYDIYGMNLDGSGVERLTGTSAPAYRHLRLSPDGTRVVFHSDLVGCYDVWVMDVDGGPATRLTNVAGIERCNEMPEWSPDGTKIAFMSSRNPELGWDTYVMNADGSGVVNVSGNPSVDPATSFDGVSGWAPDGRVVMTSNRDGTSRSYVVNPDGSGLEPLFPGTDYTDPRWSPDGSKLVAAGSGGATPDVYLLDADGTNPVNLSNDPGWDHVLWNPWSPDGSKVAFGTTRSGNTDIMVAPAGGGAAVNVTNDPGEDAFIGWTPDGTGILFASDRGGATALYRVALDGTGLERLSGAGTHQDGPDGVVVPLAR